MRDKIRVGIKKGDHIYIPFNAYGRSCLDGVLKPRVHRNLEEYYRYKRGYPTRASEDHELIEYAPVTYAKWDINGDGDLQCTNCGGGAMIHPLTGMQHPTAFCPHCNANMKQEESK